MKKTLVTLLSLVIMGSSVAFADMLPEGQMYVPGCAMVDNTADFKNTIFIAATYDLEGGTGLSSVVKVDASTCIDTGKPGYAKTELFAIHDDKDVAKYLTPIVPAKPADPELDSNAYPVWGQDGSFFSGTGKDFPIETARNQVYFHTIYHVVGIDNTTRTISVARAEEKTAVDDKKLGYGTMGMPDYDMEIKLDTPIFTDVKGNDNYVPSVMFLKRNNYVSGYPDGSYKPQNTINRAEFTKIIMHDFKSTKNYDCSKQLFKDVSTDSNNWYKDYVCKAFNEGIIKGYDDNTFRPDQPITFAEAAKIILKVEGVSTAGVTEPWYKEFIDTFVKLKIVPTSIYKSETSSAGMSTWPDSNKQITRGEMALLIRGVIDPLIKNESDPSKTDPLYTPLYGFETMPAQAQTATISIKDFQFNPTPLTVKKGTIVTWTNDDSMAHTITSDTGLTLASDNILNGKTYTHTFNDVGTFDYHCAIHPSMQGSIIVTN